MPASTSSQMQMPREPAPVAFAAERTSIEQPRPIQPMTMEQPELSMRGGKDGGVRTTNPSIFYQQTTDTFDRPFAVEFALVYVALSA
ncbi:hypothetical protein HYE68_009678 [Fusarium pseudograminearum]|nr:hypothetical protein HYE68_009678 [Fusarium pseudograminearum]